MEQMPLSADVIRSLQPYDIRVLHALERLMRRFEWVPVDDLRGATRFSEKEVQYRLGRLMARDLVRFDVLSPHARRGLPKPQVHLHGPGRRAQPDGIGWYL